jgi:hypothetical protein
VHRHARSSIHKLSGYPAFRSVWAWHCNELPVVTATNGFSSPLIAIGATTGQDSQDFNSLLHVVVLESHSPVSNPQTELIATAEAGNIANSIGGESFQ